jgi:trk system potassium uptake protein TrkA
MKVVICGAGQVGSTIAAYLSEEGNSVTLIDQDPEVISQVNEALDVQGVVGHASHPEVLEKAGAADAEMLIAATHSDEVNMVACRIAHSVFRVPVKIARVRHQSYFDPKWVGLMGRENLPVDVVISPEVEVAKSIVNRLRVPGAFNIIPMAEGRVQLVSVICRPDCPLINTPMRHLTPMFPDLTIEVVAIVRGETKIIPSGVDEMRAGDEVYFLTSTEHLPRAMSAFGYNEPQTRSVLIIGAGNIGRRLAEGLQEEMKGISIRMVELDRARAREASEHLAGVTVLHGNAMHRDVLEEAGVGTSEAVIAVMNQDENNILASMLAKQAGCEKTIALVNGQGYISLVAGLGIDTVVNPRAVTVSTILQHIRRGRIKAAHSLRDGFAEVLEVEALDTSAVVNTPISEIRKPKGMIFGLIVRENEILVPRPSSVIRPDDRVIILAAHDQVKTVEQMFAVRPEYF